MSAGIGSALIQGPGLAEIADPMAAGVDEAGRGPLAGPVYAAAVILDPAHPVPGIGDSKALTASGRESLELLIKERALAWAVAHADVEEIDRLNILHATMLAMQRAVAALPLPPSRVLVDGNRCPEFDYPAHAVVDGDARVVAIAAASILAKVARDREMVALDERYPGYGFSRHKGYATAEHRQALRLLGPSPVHRRGFAPVRDLFAG
jgi:ribonuclease HII